MNLETFKLKNNDLLYEVQDRVVGLASILDDSARESFEKEDFLKLNAKLFMTTTNFLVSSLGVKLPWPVANPKVYIKDLFNAVYELQKKYSWFKFPNYQKSHFQDPRPENDIVVGFLVKLSSLAIYVITDLRPCESEPDLVKQYETIENEYKALTLEVEQLEEKNRNFEEKARYIKKLVVEKEQEAREAGILGPSEEFTTEVLLQKKTAIERKLLTQLQEMLNERNKKVEDIKKTQQSINTNL